MPNFDCPKYLLNGPCEGVWNDGHCEVDPGQSCVFVDQGSLSASFPFEHNVYQYIPPRDWSESPFEGRKQPKRPEELIKLTLPPDLSREIPVRSNSRLERRLRAGEFVITCQVKPPHSSDATKFLNEVSVLEGHIDAVQVTDNHHASLQMSGLLAAHLLERKGFETILHMSCRDRNRNQLQADTLGAYAVGVRNILCITGEHPRSGAHQEVRPVFDLDQVQLIHVLHNMRDKGAFMSKRPLDTAPRIFIGGTVAPLTPPVDYRPHMVGLKVAAGADFIVTNPIFDLDRLEGFLKTIAELELDKKTHILVSLGVMTSVEIARSVRDHISGMIMPDSLIERLEATPLNARRGEGLKIALESVKRLREMPGVAGINFIPSVSDLHSYEIIQLSEKAGLTPPPALSLEAESHPLSPEG